MKALSSGKYKKGVATLEILIAFTILMLSMTAVIMVVFGNQSISIDTQINDEAIYKAQALMETARALSRQNFNSLVSIAPAPDDIYQKSLDVQSIDASTKKVTGTVTWTNLGRPLNISFTTLLTNPAVGSSCSATLSGDWTAPEMVSYEFGKDLVVPSDTSSGFPVTSVQAVGSKLYVTVNNNNGNNNGTLFAFDISNPTNKPSFLFGVDNAPTISEGLNAVAVSSHYAFVANAYTGSAAACTVGTNCAQLQIIDTDNPTNPPVNLKIQATTSGGKLAYGTSIFYNKGYVYLGLAKASGSGSEFHIIDVGGGGSPASPTNPILKGNYPVGNGVNAIYVKDTYAYVASPNAENLTVLDISSPLNPVRVGGYTPASSSNGESIFVKDTIIYLGRTFGTNEFYMLTSPSGALVKFKDIGSGSGTSINGLIVRESLAFLITNSQFQIWDTSGSMSQYATPLDLPGGSGTAIGCKGNYIYVGSLPANDKGSISIVGPKSVYTLQNSGDIATAQGSSGMNTITRTFVSGFSTGQTLSAAGLPAGASATFANNACSPTCSGALTINTTFPTTPVGTYPITVKDSSGSVTTTFNLIVTAQPFDYTLTNTGAITATQGSSGNNTINLALTSGATQVVTLAASGLPVGATATFTSSNSCSPTCNRTLTISTTASTPAGTYPITVTGTGGKTTMFNLIVNAPFNYSLSNSGAITMPKNATRTNTITRTLISGASTNVSLSISGLPNNTSSNFSPVSCSPTCSSTLSITTGNGTQTGSYQITVTGSPNGVGPKTTIFTLIVN